MAIALSLQFGRLLNKAEKVTNAKINAVVKGISAAITGNVGNADIAPAAVDPTKVAQGAYWFASAVLGAGTYTAAFVPVVAAYSEGLVLAFKANAGNAGAVNFDAGAGAKPLRKWGGKALEVGDIAANQIVSVRYNTNLVGGGCWEIMATPGQPLRDDYRFSAGVSSGTGPTNYAMTLANKPLAYMGGLLIAFVPDAANTGAGVTVNVNTLGAANLVHRDLSPLAAGEIENGRMVVAVHDGSTGFVVINSLKALYTPSEAVMATVKNLSVVTNAGAPNTKVDIAADEIALKNTANGRTFLASAAAVTVDIGLGVAVNGLDVGAEAANTWYYMWVISDGVTVSGLISLSSTAPTMPGAYIYKALVGAVRNDAGSNFMAMWQTGREVFFPTQQVFSSAAGSLTYVIQTLATFVPPNAKIALGNAGESTANTGGVAVAGDVNGTGEVAIVGTNGNAVSTFTVSGMFRVPMITAQNVYWKADNIAARYRMAVSGYVL